MLLQFLQSFITSKVKSKNCLKILNNGLLLFANKILHITYVAFILVHETILECTKLMGNHLSTVKVKQCDTKVSLLSQP